MTKPVSVDFQFTVQQRGRGARKQMVEGNGESIESEPALERIPRISRYIALAIHFEELISKGIVTDFADLARLGHVSRARVTQIMNLRLLASCIQEKLLLDFEVSKRCQFAKIQALTAQKDWRKQVQIWHQLMKEP
jgi:hypothetical protein